MLFELLLLAVQLGWNSPIQQQVLAAFQHHHGVEEHLFEELRERAEATHRAAQKTIAIILE